MHKTEVVVPILVIKINTVLKVYCTVPPYICFIAAAVHVVNLQMLRPWRPAAARNLILNCRNLHPFRLRRSWLYQFEHWRASDWKSWPALTKSQALAVPGDSWLYRRSLMSCITSAVRSSHRGLYFEPSDAIKGTIRAENSTFGIADLTWSISIH